MLMCALPSACRIPRSTVSRHDMTSGQPDTCIGQRTGTYSSKNRDRPTSQLSIPPS